LKIVKKLIEKHNVQERLSDLSMLSIGNEYARMINVAKMIDVFEEQKDRKNCNSKEFFQVLQ